MTNGEQPDTPNGQLREEAATWWAVMHGPEADSRREEFETWLDRGSYHRSAYNRMGEIHALGKHLKDEPDLAAKAASPRPPRRGPGKIVLPVTIFASGLLIGSWTYRQITAPRLLPPIQDVSASTAPYQRIAAQSLSTRIGEVRTVALADGTQVTLDTDSLVLVSFHPDTRLLRLERGRARITVGSDPRPFKVVADGTTLVASHATLDAARTGRAGMAIHILAGDATITSAEPGSTPVALAAGQSARVDAATPVIEPIAEPDSTWPTGIIDVDKLPMSDLVAASNRYSRIQIVLGSPDLGDLRVSGLFRVNDTAMLAHRLAELFGLHLDKRSDDRIVLQR